MKKIAVLLAAYNGERWIQEQIQSIINQKNVSVHLFISLDSSTDASLSILQNIVSTHDNISLLPYGEKFGAAAPNFFHLIEDVCCDEFDYVALSDQDDIWLEAKLFSGILKIEENKAAGYSSNVTAFWANGKQKNVKKASHQKKYDFLFEGPGPGCSFIMTRQFFNEFKTQLINKKSIAKKIDWHDWLIYAYARSKQYNWYIDKDSYMLYRQHENNQLGANSGLKQFTKRVHDICSGYGIYQTALTVNFCDFENEDFVKRWYMKGRKGYFFLMNHSNMCRRRLKDIFLFWGACLSMFIINSKMEEE